MSRNRPFVGADNVGPTCACLDCQMAGVTHLSTMKVPADEFHPRPRWIHGEELRAYHEARDRAMGAIGELRKKLTMPPASSTSEGD